MVSGVAGARTQQLCWLLPASLSRPGDGASLKAPQRDTPRTQLGTLYAAAEVLQPISGSQHSAMGHAVTASLEPQHRLSLGEGTASQGCSASCQVEPQTCTFFP